MELERDKLLDRDKDEKHEDGPEAEEKVKPFPVLPVRVNASLTFALIVPLAYDDDVELELELELRFRWELSLVSQLVLLLVVP